MAVRCHPIVSRAAARTLTSATRIDMALAIEAQSPRHAGAIGGDPPWRSGGCECEEPTAPTDAGHGNAEATAGAAPARNATRDVDERATESPGTPAAAKPRKTT